MNLVDKYNNFLVIGCSETGYKSAVYLSEIGKNVRVMDQSLYPQYKSEIEQGEHSISSIFGMYHDHWFKWADVVVLSPGVNINKQPWVDLVANGSILVSDIEIFLQQVPKSWQIVGVTGTNGKTSCVNFLNKVANDNGLRYVCAGNIGIASLSILSNYQPDELDGVILEISSYHLTTTKTKRIDLGLILNIEPDHIDWHGSFKAYKNAKLNLFNVAKHMIAPVEYDHDCLYTLGSSVGEKQLGWKECGTLQDINQQVICSVNDLTRVFDIDLFNTKAVASVVMALNWSVESFVRSLKNQSHLEHRLEQIQLDNITWYNDSKSTNIHSLKHAISCVSKLGKTYYLIAGGVLKSEGALDLEDKCFENLALVCSFGQDAGKVLNLFPGNIQGKQFIALNSVVEYLYSVLLDDDIVLFSPGCASFDQYDNYIHRGYAFKSF